ncbi:MAG: ABC transporter permease [Bacteroidota bacterium]
METPEIPLVMWFELLKDFFFDLNANRVRAALTLAAITWGTVAVVLLLSFGDGLGTQMMNGLLNAGDRILIVYGGETGLAHEGLPKGRRIRLLEEDVELLDRIVPAIDMISPQYRKTITGGVAALDLNIGRRLLRAARRR